MNIFTFYKIFLLHRCFNTKKISLSNKTVCHHTFSYADTFTQTISHKKSFCTLFFTHKDLYTETLSDSVFYTRFLTQKLYTQKLQKLLQTENALEVSPTLYQAFQTCSGTFSGNRLNLTAQKFPTCFRKLLRNFIKPDLTVLQSFRNLFDFFPGILSNPS